MSSLYSTQGAARSNRMPRIAGAAVERARLSVVPVARTRAANKKRRSAAAKKGARKRKKARR